jgi:hypothetical protein
MKIMEPESFIHHKIANFKNIKVTTKLWKVKIVLPWSNNLKENDKHSVWIISKVLN